MEEKSMADQVGQEEKAAEDTAVRNTAFGSEHTFADEAAATEAYVRSVEKLFHVNAWSDLSMFTADFTLYDQAAQPKLDGTVEPGDYILINLPGPLPINWVRVTDKQIDECWAEFTVQPSADPRETNSGEVVHFFTDQARSTFRVERSGTRITAAEIGQQEAINNHEKAGDRALINTAIAEGGWLFYQKIQWKLLTDYLVHL
jgi:hypothetical protein